MTTYMLRLILITSSAENENNEVYFTRYLKEGFLIADETKEAVSALLATPRKAFEARLKEAVLEGRAFTQSEERVREIWQEIDWRYPPEEGIKIIRFEIFQFSKTEPAEASP